MRHMRLRGTHREHKPGPDLLHVFLGPDVRGVHQRAHDLQVAVDHEGLVRPVGVDADPAVVVHRIWQLAALPQHLVVAFKLARVGGLVETHEQTALLIFRDPDPQDFDIFASWRNVKRVSSKQSFFFFFFLQNICHQKCKVCHTLKVQCDGF